MSVFFSHVLFRFVRKIATIRKKLVIVGDGACLQVVFSTDEFPESYIYFYIPYGWLRSTVGRTSVFGRRADPVLRSACSRRVTTSG